MQLTHMKCRMYTRVGHGKGVEHKCSVGRVQAGKVTQQSMADTVDSLWRTGFTVENWRPHSRKAAST